MRSLRYWLGLPLFNLILCIACVLYFGFDSKLPEWLHIFLDHFVGVMLGFGVLIIPFLTALYFPVGRRGGLTLWQKALLSGAVIFFVCLVVMTVTFDLGLHVGSINFFGLFTAVSAALAFVETASYSLGLLVIWLIHRSKNKSARSEDTQT